MPSGFPPPHGVINPYLLVMNYSISSKCSCFKLSFRPLYLLSCFLLFGLLLSPDIYEVHVLSLNVVLWFTVRIVCVV